LIDDFGKGEVQEWNWNPASRRSFFLVSTRDGKRTSLAKKLPPGFRHGKCDGLSPTGKYALCMDDLLRNFLSYELETGASHNLTQRLPIPLTEADYDEDARPPSRGINDVAWLSHDAALLISDRYDVWRLDPTGEQPPVNVTNGYGRRHHIKFELLHSSLKSGIDTGDELILAAFNEATKDSGFYSKVLGEKGDPRQLTMGPYTYTFTDVCCFRNGVGIGDKRTYLVRRESSTEAPNFFYTVDFKTYTPLTQVYPERTYNWLTSELVNFKTSDGRKLRGVLYKPENFDPGRKYAVIFNYYEKRSDELNRYHQPGAMEDQLNIPWFVSRGYLVFTPDIHYAIGHPGKSACDAVVSAARYLSGFPWVDPKRMGIQGFSFGGFETNYIVTHTNLFAAAMSSSGLSDTVSDYDAVSLRGYSTQYRYELNQMRIGSTLWQRPDLYIENSPIFRADKVTTPLLMMNNKEDVAVPFAQGVELFTALRRLGKKVWMLQYDGEGHGIGDERVRRQHTVRVTQFFDYYLKGAPPPKWMTEGIPARFKGIETGLDLDTSGQVP
jgi:dienelactone hydrolase